MIIDVDQDVQYLGSYIHSKVKYSLGQRLESTSVWTFCLGAMYSMYQLVLILGS